MKEAVRFQLEKDIIIKTAGHGLLDDDELKDYNWHARNISGMSMLSVSLIPAQLIVWFNARGDAAKRNQMLMRSLPILALTCGGMVIFGVMQSKFIDGISKKYM